MACVNCKKIRSAILHGRMAEAAGMTVEALREKVGLVPISTATEMLAERAAASEADTESRQRGKQSR